MTGFNYLIYNGCRTAILPGFQNPVGPSQPGSSPVILVPSEPKPAFPVFIPNGDPPGGPGTGGPTTPNPQFPGPGGPSTGGPTTTGPTGPSTGGPAGPTTTGPTGPSTGGPAKMYRCQEIRFICPEDLERPLSQQRVRSILRNCVEEFPGLGPGVIASGMQGNEGYVIVLGGLKTQQQCAQSCVPPQSVFSVTCGPLGGGGGGGGGSEPPQNYVRQTLSEIEINQQNQNTSNGNEISVDKSLLPRFQANLYSNVYTPSLYDPQKNFFKVAVTTEIESSVNNSYRNVFRQSVAKEVNSLLRYQSTINREWEETAIQNLTDEKLIFSLNSNLVEAFNNLRDITGKVIGLSSFLEVVRKHIVTGTLNEFNPEYYLRSYQLQKSNKFVSFAKSESKSSNELFSLLYLKDSEFNLSNTPRQGQKLIEMGRFRFLNEDLNVSLGITKEDGSKVDLSVPNEGIPINFLASKSASTPPSVGSPELLNIGDGGGYYFASRVLDDNQIPVATSNSSKTSYYAPASVRSALLEVVDSSFEYTIKAKSLVSKNEFVSGDTGTSVLEPLYFGANLASVSSFSFNNGTVESYSSTYSRITEPSSIQQHINNNALSIPEVYLDYRDPLYRYILDASSFDMESKDLSNKGFESNPVVLGEDNFVKNIPFAFIIIPSRGSNFNPFNGRSTVTEMSDTVTREITLRPPINTSISKEKSNNFEFYNLYNDDGSKRIGFNEEEDFHNFGYRYVPSNYYNSFYSDGSVSTSSSPVSSYGSSYLVKDVLDFIKDEHNPSSIVWFDVFSRMPLSKVGELMYDMPEGFMDLIANGYRHGIHVKNAQRSSNNPVSLLPSDSKTIVNSSNRKDLRSVDR